MTAGRVLVHGKSIAETRGLVAYVPQQGKVNWRMPMSVWDVVILGLAHRVGWFRRPGRAERTLAEDALRQVGMWERRSRQVSELSGGQRQRVFVARALAQGADILLMDEAFNGVDIASQEALVSVLLELRDQGKTILLSSHDINHLAHYCGRVSLPQLPRLRLRRSPGSAYAGAAERAVRALRGTSGAWAGARDGRR